MNVGAKTSTHMEALIIRGSPLRMKQKQSQGSFTRVRFCECDCDKKWIAWMSMTLFL